MVELEGWNPRRAGPARLATEPPHRPSRNRGVILKQVL
jgi:hypothetical protein